MTLNLIDKAGQVFGLITLPATALVADLKHLRALGAVRIEVKQ
ncbi:hypothetical protein [Pseudomonas sp. TMP25]